MESRFFKILIFIVFLCTFKASAHHSGNCDALKDYDFSRFDYWKEEVISMSSEYNLDSSFVSELVKPYKVNKNVIGNDKCQPEFTLTFSEYLEKRISDLRIDLLDFIFLDTYFKFFFTAFCILILINGSNFIDGSNGLNLGYFSIVLCIIQILISDNIIDVKNDSILICLIGIIFLLILNYFNFLYLGDSGAYIISFVVGSLLIYIYQNNPNISPYFIALILWYPAFENFFSIIRKKISKISPIDPDTNHLHHLIFKFLLRQNFFFKKYSNQLTSTLIVLYNLIIFLIAINYVSETNESILLIILNIIVYLSIYTYLKNKLSLKR